MVLIAFVLLFLAVFRAAPPAHEVPAHLRAPAEQLAEPDDEAIEDLRRQIEAAVRNKQKQAKPDAGSRPDSGMRWFDGGSDWLNDPILKRAAVGESIPSDGSWDPLNPDASHASERERDTEK